MTLGERIKAARKEKGITQKELADLINKGFSTVQKYEIDVIEPPISVLEKIAEALEVNLSVLLDWNRPIDETDKELLKIYPNFNPKYGYISDMVNGEYPEEVKSNGIRQDTIAKYDSLNALGQKKANEYITDLSEQEKYTTPDEEKNPR